MTLDVRELNTYYGTSHILFDVSLRVDRGEVVCLLGRNGAGKTTIIRSIMGLTVPRTGSVAFEGEEVMGKPSYYRAKRGMGYVPEDRRVFPTLTVHENLELAMKKPRDARGADDVWSLDRVYGIFPDLGKLQHHPAGHLSGGQQQMLAIARALMGNPILLLMDEPTQGLAPLLVRTLAEQVRRLKEAGETILLSEQNLWFATAVSDRVYVIEKGAIRYHGAMKDLEEDQEVKRKYLMV